MNWFFKRSPTKEIQLQVEYLHCEMCAQTVREALQKVAGVNKVRDYSALNGRSLL